jgi:hypothetical protein
VVGVLKTVTVLAAVCAVACGSSERSATPSATKPARSTPSPTATPTTAAAPERARSVRACAKLWNADALDPSNFQVSANEFIAELAPVRVHVAYQHRNCFVVAPIGNRRIAISTAVDGRRPFTNPDRRRLKPGERVPYNAHADRKGRVSLDP